MNASTRWATHFVEALECVRCRAKENLSLYFFSGEKVDPTKLSIEELRWSLNRMDVWCTECYKKKYTNLVNMRVAGPGRLAHKREAAWLADMRVQSAPDEKHDLHSVTNGKQLSKVELLSIVKQRPCQLCRGTFPAVCLDFYANGRKKWVMFGTLRTMIETIQQCVLLCANCGKLVEHGLKDMPEEKIQLDENFLTSTV